MTTKLQFFICCLTIFFLIGCDNHTNPDPIFHVLWGSYGELNEDAGALNIFSIDSEGRQEIQLTHGTFHSIAPDVSPNQQQIVFVCGSDSGNDIWLVNVDGTDLVNLTQSPGIREQSPVFSPDGTTIIFVRSGSDTNICSMNIDGSNPANLSNTNSGEYFNPRVSPDGSKIAFTSNRDGSYQLYIMNTDGSDQLKLTDFAPTIYDMTPIFSPDGTKIIFSYGVNLEHDIYSVNSDGSDLTNLTNSAALDNFPCYSPDGDLIAFRKYDSEGPNGIHLMNSDGGNIRFITAGSLPFFSPDGDRLVYVSNADGNNDIYIIDLDGKNKHNITNGSRYIEGPFAVYRQL